MLRCLRFVQGFFNTSSMLARLAQVSRFLPLPKCIPPCSHQFLGIKNMGLVEDKATSRATQRQGIPLQVKSILRLKDFWIVNLQPPGTWGFGVKHLRFCKPNPYATLPNFKPHHKPQYSRAEAESPMKRCLSDDSLACPATSTGDSNPFLKVWRFRNVGFGGLGFAV